MHLVTTIAAWWAVTIGLILFFMQASHYVSIRSEDRGTQGHLDYALGTLLVTVLIAIVAVLLTWGKI